MTHSIHSPASPKRSPRWWGLCGGLVFLFLLLSFPIIHAIWSMRARNALDAQVSALRSAGQPVAPEDLNQPPVDEALNIVPHLRAAESAIDANSQAWKNAFSSSRTYGLPLTDQEQSAFRALIQVCAPALDHVRAATTRPAVDWGIQFRSPMIQTLLPDLQKQRSVANLLGIAVLQAHQDGDDASAIRHLRELQFISNAMDDQPFIVTHLVAIGIGALGNHRTYLIAPDLKVAPEGADPRAATPQQVRQLIADLLDERPFAQGYRRAVQGERVSQLNTAQLVAAGKLSLSAIGGTGASGATSPAATAVTGYLARPVFLADAEVMLEDATTALGAVTAPDWPTARQKLPGDRNLAANRSTRPLARALQPSYQRTGQIHFRALADRRTAAAVLAIRLYAVDHEGSPPPNLDALVPQYLPAVLLQETKKGKCFFLDKLTTGISK